MVRNLYSNIVSIVVGILVFLQMGMDLGFTFLFCINLVSQMDLAMTYASRSQHLQLARHISELCQQKYSGGSDPEPSDGEEEGEAEWTNRNGHSNEEELSYARERTILLRQGLSRFPPPSALTNGARALGGSKFSRYKDAMKKGKRIRSAGSHAHSTGAR